MSQMSDEVLKSIFTVNLGVKKDERVLVFTDVVNLDERVPEEESQKREELRDIAKEVAEAGREFCSTDYLEFPSVGGHGKEPPAIVWMAAFGEEAVSELEKRGVLKKILSKEAGERDIKAAEAVISEKAKSPDAVIALSNFSTSHTRFRDLLTRVRGARYASMPLFERPMMDGAMTADWNRVEARTKRLIEMMSGGDMVVLTSHNGTSMVFSMKGRDVLPDTGILTKKGSFGNLPAGEAFLAPVEGTAEGSLVLEWAPTGKLRQSICLEVKNGRVVEVEGTGEFAEDLREKIGSNPLIGNIAELGIGTNDRAERPDNILETEKILGTVHVALGDNSSFGGKVSVPFHQDFIFFRPTLEVFKGGQKTEVIVEGDPRF
ncbi:MAG: aminopeptidase [Deltaproteobacteria bacterium]|nr:aminopeptidase [Deltaproteobacteria bacterium]